MKFKSLVALFFATIIVIFSIQNADVTDVEFLFWKLSMSRVLIILGSFAMGVLVGILVSMKRTLLTSKD